MMAVTVRRALPSDWPWVNERYAEVGFMPSSGHDLVALAEVDGQRSGLGRIVPVDEQTGELGGMYVLPGSRGQALAGCLIDFLLRQPEASRPLFCIPFAHLRAFYERHGFVGIDECMKVPEAIAAKLAWCQDQYPEPVCLLHRPPNASRPL